MSTSRRSSLALPMGVFLIAALVTGFALWRVAVSSSAGAGTPTSLTGGSAPRSVVADFGAYTPQLGFNPEPGNAVLVAEDGDVSLYATTNTQGSYCILASAPWKRPSKDAGSGTCIATADAAAPLIAGFVGARGNTYLIAGRTADPEARAIRFADPSGKPITRPIGSSGFFIATVNAIESACTNGDWNPTFSVLAANGEERSRQGITLGYASLDNTVCRFPAPSAPR